MTASFKAGLEWRRWRWKIFPAGGDGTDACGYPFYVRGKWSQARRDFWVDATWASDWGLEEKGLLIGMAWSLPGLGGEN